MLWDDRTAPEDDFLHASVLQWLWTRALRWPPEVIPQTQFVLIQASDPVAVGRLLSTCDPPPNAVYVDSSDDDLDTAFGRVQEAATDPPPMALDILHNMTEHFLERGLGTWMAVEEGIMKEHLEMEQDKKELREREQADRARTAEARDRARRERRNEMRRHKRKRTGGGEGSTSEGEGVREEEGEGEGEEGTGDAAEETDPADETQVLQNPEAEGVDSGTDTHRAGARRDQQQEAAGAEHEEPETRRQRRGSGDARARSGAVADPTTSGRRTPTEGGAGGGGAGTGGRTAAVERTPVVPVPTLSQISADAPPEDVPVHAPLVPFPGRGGGRGRGPGGRWTPPRSTTPTRLSPFDPRPTSLLTDPVAGPVHPSAPAVSHSSVSSGAEAPPPAPTPTADPPAAEAAGSGAARADSTAERPGTVDPTDALRRRSHQFALGLSQVRMPPPDE